MSLVARTARLLLMAMLCVDAGLLFARALAARDLRSARSPFVTAMARISLPTGYTAEARAYAPPARFRCALIEYVSASCRYCSTEQGGGATLARKLAAAGCVVITLAPSRAELRPAAEGASEVQLVYLAPNWLATVPRLQLVPTMILVGGDGRVAWFKVGELTQTDVAAALSVLEER